MAAAAQGLLGAEAEMMNGVAMPPPITVFPGDNWAQRVAMDGLILVVKAANAADPSQVWDPQGNPPFVLRNRASGRAIVHAHVLPRPLVNQGFYNPFYLFAPATWDQVAPAVGGIAAELHGAGAGGELVCVSAQLPPFQPPLNFIQWGQNPQQGIALAAAEEEQGMVVDAHAHAHAEEEMEVVEAEAEEAVVQLPDPTRPTSSCCGRIKRRLRSCFGCL